LGGKNEIPGAFCLPCKRPYLLMMSLDVRDPRLNLSFPLGRKEGLLEGDGRELHDLPLLYCWSCGPCLDYRVNPEGGIDVLNHSKDASWPDSCWPYEPYPDNFPSRSLRLASMPSRAQSLISKRNAGKLSDSEKYSRKNQELLLIKHQIGGEPRIQQGNDLARGVLCKRRSPFLAAVAGETGSKQKFSSYGVQVLFFYCAPCQVVSALHDCD
jgi:hypothetical protein